MGDSLLFVFDFEESGNGDFVCFLWASLVTGDEWVASVEPTSKLQS